jgi:hypothetical protein
MCHLSQCARQKCGFLAKEIPNYTQELEHNPPHVMIWAGMTPDYLRLIGPYFFDGPVKAASYSAMMETWIIRQLRNRGLLGDVWLQHDGAPHTWLFLCAMFEGTFSRPLDWSWLTNFSVTIAMATT